MEDILIKIDMSRHIETISRGMETSVAFVMRAITYKNTFKRPGLKLMLIGLHHQSVCGV